MAVQFAMINSDSTTANLPTETANTVNVGINAQADMETIPTLNLLNMDIC